METKTIDYRKRCRVCTHQVSELAYIWLPKHKDGNGVWRIVCIKCRNVGFDVDGTIPPEVEY